MKKIIIFFTLFFFTLQIDAKESEPSVGLSAALTGNQLDIMFPFLLKSNNVILPSIGISYQEDIGQLISASLKYRHYTGTYGGAKSFFGAGAGGLISVSDEGDTSVDILFGLSYGVEYFFSKNFSCGLEAQLNALLPDEGSTNARSMNINTATMVFISIYY